MQNKEFIIITILLAIAFFLPSFIFAETIVLKSGKTVEGKLIEKTDKYIKIDFQGVPLTYFLDEIESIDGIKQALVAEKEREPSAKSPSDLPYSKESMEQGQKGAEYFKQGNFKEAIPYFQQAIQLDPNNFTAYWSLGISYNSLGDHKQAIKIYEKGIKSAPKYSALFYTGIAGEYNQLQEYNKAIDAASDSIKHKPGNPQPYMMLGQAYYMLKDYKQARENLNKALELANEQKEFQLIEGIKSAISKIPN